MMIKKISRRRNHEHVNKTKLELISRCSLFFPIRSLLDCWFFHPQFTRQRKEMNRRFVRRITYNALAEKAQKAIFVRAKTTKKTLEVLREGITFEQKQNDKQIDIKTEIIYFLWAPQILLSTRCSGESAREREEASDNIKMYGGAERNWKNFFCVRHVVCKKKQKKFHETEQKEDEERKERATKHPQPLPSINMEIEMSFCYTTELVPSDQRHENVAASEVLKGSGLSELPTLTSTTGCSSKLFAWTDLTLRNLHTTSHVTRRKPVSS